MSEQAIKQAIETYRRLEQPQTIQMQMVLMKRATRLCQSLSMVENMVVRRAIKMPLDCGGKACGMCDECWFDLMADKLVAGSRELHADIPEEKLREISRRLVREEAAGVGSGA